MLYVHLLINNYIMCLNLAIFVYITCALVVNYTLFKNCYLFFRERGKEKEREKNINVKEKLWLVAFSMHPHPGTWTHNLHMCPDWESNQWPFIFQDNTQPTEPHQSGCNCTPLTFLWVAMNKPEILMKAIQSCM